PSSTSSCGATPTSSVTRPRAPSRRSRSSGRRSRPRRGPAGPHLLEVVRMDQRISFVTLAVADLDGTRRFYLDGLGWRAELDVPGEVLMVRVGEHLVLSLRDGSQFEGEVGPIRRCEGLAPITLAHNVAREEEVDAV